MAELRPLIGLAADIAKRYGLPAEVVENIIIAFIESLYHSLRPEVEEVYLKFDKEWSDENKSDRPGR